MKYHTFRMKHCLVVLVLVAVGGASKQVHTYETSYSKSLHEDTKIRTPRSIQCMLTAEPPDRKTQCCGVDPSPNYRIIPGNKTALEQYPWLALIEYKTKDNTLTTACGGFLISGRYVLTAAHCLSEKSVKKVGVPTNVILGEYNRANEGLDCVEVLGGTDCNDGTTEITIENYVIHPNYQPLDKVSSKNDIALIRLTETAPYTDFIRPICLPDKDWNVDPPERFKLNIAGWGATVQERVNEQGKWTYINVYSAIKLHVAIPFKDIKKCQETYPFVGETHICAGGEAKDLCRGDSGGPLMYEQKGVFESVGIVSFGLGKCGTSNVPAVYTNVYHFRDWINVTIRQRFNVARNKQI